MKIVLLGCGRVGARLAMFMEDEGHEVSIIDSHPDAFDRLPEGFKGQTVLGTGIDVDVLKSAGIEGADAFAAVTNFDNTNIMACEVAKEIFGVKKVLARIYDPGREMLYHELGLETICPTTLISTTARDILLAPDGVEVLDFPPHTDGRGNATPPASNVGAVGASIQAATPAGDVPLHTQPVRQQADRSAGQSQGKDTTQKGGLRGFFRH